MHVVAGGGGRLVAGGERKRGERDDARQKEGWHVRTLEQMMTDWRTAKLAAAGGYGGTTYWAGKRLHRVRAVFTLLVHFGNLFKKNMLSFFVNISVSM